MSTSTVGAQTGVTITGNFAASRTATLTVNHPPMPIAKFTVSGASGTDKCMLINGGNNFDCTFDGSASTTTSPGKIIQWNWTYTIGGSKSEPGGPTHAPNPNCGLLPSNFDPKTKPAFINMIVSLKVHDDFNNDSVSVTDNNVQLLPSPTKVCGF